MECSKCPYHWYEAGFEDADEGCMVFGGYFPPDGKSRKDEDGCIFNLRTLAKYKRLQDLELEVAIQMAEKRGGIEQ